MANFFNMLLLLLGSWLGIQSAIEHTYAIAPVIILFLLAFHVAFVNQRLGEVSIIIITGIAGAFVESINILADVYQYNTMFPYSGLLPTWIVFIWFVIGAGIRHCFKLFARQWYLAALLGAALGPLFYFSADLLGAIHFTSATTSNYILPAVLWALAMPLIAAANNLLNSAAQNSQ